MRTFLVSPIRGALLSFIEAFDKLEFNFNEDLLIFMGDYTGEWAHGPETISYLWGLRARCKVKPLFLMGKEDYYVKHWLDNGEQHLSWLSSASSNTRRQLSAADAHKNPIFKRFYNALIPYFVDNNNNAYVTGGFEHNEGLGNESVTSYLWNYTLWNSALTLHRTYKSGNLGKGSKYHKYNTIYIAGSSTIITSKINDLDVEDYTKPITACNVYNINTGTNSKSGKISIVHVDSGIVRQSEEIGNTYGDNNLIVTEDKIKML